MYVCVLINKLYIEYNHCNKRYFIYIILGNKYISMFRYI